MSNQDEFEEMLDKEAELYHEGYKVTRMSMRTSALLIGADKAIVLSYLSGLCSTIGLMGKHINGATTYYHGDMMYYLPIILCVYQTGITNPKDCIQYLISNEYIKHVLHPLGKEYFRLTDKGKELIN